MKKIFFLLFMSILFCFGVRVSAKATQVYVSGANLGIKLNTDIEVLGTFGVETKDNIVLPWKDLVYEHDKILMLNNKKIASANQFIKEVESSNGKTLKLSLSRHGQIEDVMITPVKNKLAKYSVGLYIKDYEMGVGTLSFVEPTTLSYASLGHKMIDRQIESGDVYKARVKEIILPRDNLAGAKKAEFVGDKIGSATKNLDNGVYGILTDNSILKNATTMSLAKASEAKRGSATILTSIDDMKVESFRIEITECKSQTANEIKGIKFKVTDENLIARTGGIIQGMSGSPIIQNGKLIGAVTHVVLKDASFGFGCYAEFMYNTMGFSLND